MHYKPEKSDGKPAQIPWQIKMLPYNFSWPLKDNPTLLMRSIDYCLIAMGFVLYIVIDEGEILFVVQNSNDINVCIQGMVTCVVINEAILRIFYTSFNKRSFKEFYKTFFRRIYIDGEEHSIITKKINQRLIPNTVYTYGYFCAVITLIVTPLVRKNHDLVYKMILHYNYDDPLIYGLTMLYLSVLGYSIVVFLVGDGYLLAYCILHLNGRYTILQEELDQTSSHILATVPKSELTEEFHKQLLRFFVRISDLNHFTKSLNETYTFGIFVMIAFSIVLLCILCFEVASLGVSSENIAYILWTVGKIVELLIVGSLGNTLIETTDGVSSMYYLSNWEQIIYHSTNRKQNVLLMKDLQIIMAIHRNPSRLSGYGFFFVSLETVVKVLRGAFSYFTCLYALK